MRNPVVRVIVYTIVMLLIMFGITKCTGSEAKEDSKLETVSGETNSEETYISEELKKNNTSSNSLEEDEIIRQKYEDALDSERKKREKKAEPEIIEEYLAIIKNENIGEYKPMSSVSKLNKIISVKGTSEFDKVNRAIYDIAEEAINHPGVKNIPDNLRNPNILLAQSMTEYLDRTDVQKVWVPAIPVRFLPNDRINVETLKTFNVAEAIKLDGYAQSIAKNRTYQGPYQLSPTYGITNNPGYNAEGVQFRSELDNIRSDADALKLYNKGVGWYGSRVRSSQGTKVGDRHNFNDASIVAIQTWDYYYGKLSQQKKDVLTSEASLVAFIGMNHNIGQSVAVEKNMSRPSQICSGCTYGNIWEYIGWFGSEQATQAFKTIANQKVAAFKRGGTLTHISREEARQLAQQNNAGSALIAQLNYNNEKTLHPIRMVMWYYVLEELYHN